MKRLLVVLAICFMSLFSFVGISEAAWELSGTDPDLGPFWYESSSIITGKDPGTVCFKHMVKRPDKKGGYMISHIMIDKARMYAIIYWGEMSDSSGKIVVSTEQRTPLLIAGLTPAWKNVIATVLNIYDNTPPERRKTFLDYVLTSEVPPDEGTSPSGEGTKSSGEGTKSNDTSAASSAENEAYNTLLDYMFAVNEKNFEKAYSYISPEGQKNLSYKKFVKSMDVDGLQVKIIEHKVIYSNDFSVKFQLISETSSKVKNGTKVEKAIETITFQKYPSGWKMTEASNTPIDQKVIPNQAGRKVLFTGTLDGKIKK